MKTYATYILVIVFCAAQVAFAQKETPPAGGKPKNFVLPAKTGTTLTNGLKTTLVKYGEVPKVSIQVIVKTGNIHEGPDEDWLGDLTALMMKEGTKTLSAKEIAKKAAAMGGEVSITAGIEQFNVSGTVLSEYAPDFISLLADIVINPSFPASELERLKNDVKRQVSVGKTVPQNIASERFFTHFYKDHPYNLAYPSEEQVATYKLEDVVRFYNEQFGAQRTIVYAAGKFDEKKVAAAIESAFSTWKKGPEVTYPKAEVNNTPAIEIIDRPAAPQTTIMVGLSALTPKDKDYIPFVVTNTLLGGAFGSRITTNIREDKGYSYSPFSTLQNRQGNTIWYEQADVTSEFTGASLQEIAKEVKRLQDEKPSEKELEGIKNYQAGIFVLQNSNMFGIINQLNFIDRFGLPDSYLTDYVHNVHAITADDVQRLAKSQLPYEKMSIILVGDKKLLEKQITADQRKLLVK